MRDLLELRNSLAFIHFKSLDLLCTSCSVLVLRARTLCRLDHYGTFETPSNLARLTAWRLCSLSTVPAWNVCVRTRYFG